MHFGYGAIGLQGILRGITLLDAAEIEIDCFCFSSLLIKRSGALTHAINILLTAV